MGLSAWTAMAQGVIELRVSSQNPGAPGYFIYETNLQDRSTRPLSFQVYAGPKGAASTDLQAYGPVASTADVAPRVKVPILVTLPGIPPGSPAVLQLRFWDSEAGRVNRFEEARTRGVAPVYYVSSVTGTNDSTKVGFPEFVSRLDTTLVPPSVGIPLSVPRSAPGASLQIISSSPSRDLVQSSFDTFSVQALSGDGATALLSHSSYSGGPFQSFTAYTLRTWRETGQQIPEFNYGAKSGGESYVVGDRSVFIPPAYFSWAGSTIDGSLVLWNRNGAGIYDPLSGQQSTPMLGNPEPRWRLPEMRALGISADGRFVFGYVPKFLGEGQKLVRISLADFSRIEANVTVDGWLGASPNGELAVVSTGFGTSAKWRRVIFSETTSTVEPLAVPAGFEPTLISGDATVLADKSRLWSDRWGIANTIPAPAGVTLQFLSLDGTVAAGMTSQGAVLSLLDGTVIPLAEALPGVELPAGVPSQWDGLSPDGRNGAFTQVSTNVIQGIPFDVIYRARMVVPELNPAVVATRVGTSETGVLRLRFPTRKGLSYRVELSQDLRTWAESAAWAVGDGSDRIVDTALRGTPGARSFLRVALRPSR